MISLCMIVKDEQQYLAQCLESVHQIVDEIIVVDTGSSDNSKTICQSYGATVLDFKFNQDFSEARNYGLSHARNPWILVLDADEFIDAEDAAQIRSLVGRIEQSGLKGCEFIRYDYFNNAGWSEAKIVRLFKNDPGIAYVGKIYEQVNIEREETYCNDSIVLKIHHFGYRKNKDFIADKRKMYDQITTRARDSGENKHKLFYWGAQNCLIHNEWDEAIKLCDQGIEDNYQSKRLYELKSRLLLLQGKYSESREAVQHVFKLEESKRNKSIFYYRAINDLAQSYYYETRYEEALDVINNSISNKPAYILANMAFILDKSQRYEEALDHYKRALAINPYLEKLEYVQDDNLKYLAHTFFDFSGIHLERLKLLS